MSDPLRTYSSDIGLLLDGAATPNKDRDQLLINKILSFGDQEFQMRCEKP
jgi:ABC-type polysaccharide/polyol phosphate transport system ATPase subunit